MHTDGTIITVDGDSIIGINPTTGQSKFQIDLEHGMGSDSGNCGEFPPTSGPNHPVVSSQAIIAGDGFAYFAYSWGNFAKTYACPSGEISLVWDTHLIVVRVGTDGNYQKISVGNWDQSMGSVPNLNSGFLITDGDQGVLYSWALCSFSNQPTPCTAQYSLTHITNGVPSTVTTNIGYQIGNSTYPVQPKLQRQDGTYVGSLLDGSMVVFDVAGNLKWQTPNYDPKIATADGGVIVQSGDGTVALFDQNGGSTVRLQVCQQNHGWTICIWPDRLNQ